MEPAFARKLQTAAVDDYRQNYRRFRKGKAQGAKGERPPSTVPMEQVSHRMERLLGGSSDRF